MQCSFCALVKAFRNAISTGELSQKFTEPRINGPKAVFGIVGKII